MANEFKRMQKLAGIITENQEYYKDAEADDAEHIDALEKDMKDDAKPTSEGKMKMSELKAAIKKLAEGEDDININDDESLYDPVYEDLSMLSMRDKNKIEQIIQMLNGVDGETMEYILRQVGMEDQMANQLVHNRAEMSEAKKDKEVEDIKDVDVTVGDEETTTDIVTTDVDPDVKAVQDALTQAQAAAEKLGDEKLTDQIGNTITFFTRTHIVDKPTMTTEVNIKKRINKLIKSL